MDNVLFLVDINGKKIGSVVACVSWLHVSFHVQQQWQEEFIFPFRTNNFCDRCFPTQKSAVDTFIIITFWFFILPVVLGVNDTDVDPHCLPPL